MNQPELKPYPPESKLGCLFGAIRAAVVIGLVNYLVLSSALTLKLFMPSEFTRGHVALVPVVVGGPIVQSTDSNTQFRLQLRQPWPWGEKKLRL